jgi:hypothetical protein
MIKYDIQLFHACSGNSQNYWPEVLEMTWELLPEASASGNSSQVISSTEGLFYYLIYMHITTNPLKMIMSAYHTIKKLGHNIVLKEIQHLTGMTHCASFSGTEQFGSGSRGTSQLFHSAGYFKNFLVIS